MLRKSVAANAILAPSGGKIGMGETRPGNSLEVEIGGATLADHWSTRSSPRWKTNIHTLDGALETVECPASPARGVTACSKSGRLPKEWAQVLPEVVSYEQRGVDLREWITPGLRLS